MDLIFKMFGVQWVLPEKVLDFSCGWWSRGPNSDVSLTPLCLMWIRIYMEGKKLAYFEDVES